MGLQEHIYNSLLQSRTPDVTLRVRASSGWHASYRLHRVVLIQSGFFHSLFTAGFAESSSQPGDIDIIFDDANITRAAFEFCISRLYGGGPPLHIFPVLIPSTSQPLTFAYPFTNVDVHPSTPSGHHPATPRFLISLLATSVYLSIPSLAAHALSSILSTVGPFTVLHYLDFALGKPIGPADLKWNEPDAAVGLEHIAQLTEDDAHSDSSLHSVGTTEAPVSEFHYGAMSDKIGEAAACWLTRWGPDMLAFEELKAGIAVPPTSTTSRRRSRSDAGKTDYSAAPTIWDRGGLDVAWVCALIASDTLFVRGERERYDLARAVVELRRRHGIIQEEEEAWKTLFEQGIHYCHMSMEDVIFVSQDNSPTTKQPFVSIAVLQASHWQNSILRQQITARPTSSSEMRSSPAPTPGSPVQREKELGITLTTADIRARMAAADPSIDYAGPYYLVPTDSSLRLGDDGSSVHPPSSDSTSISMDELFTTSFASLGPASPTTPQPSTLGRAHAGEANFFGIQTRRYTARACIAADPAGTARWTLHPPFRFGVEFWDAEALPEKARLYSRTVWWGGSFFNTYVQVVRKKGTVQLGIYLHRQSTIDVPGASAPRSENHDIQGSPSQQPGTRERQGSLVGHGQSPTHTRGPSLPAITTSPTHYSPSIHPTPPTRSTTPVSVSSSLPSSLSSTFGGAHPSGMQPGGYMLYPSAPPHAPYRDTRPSVSAYFMISCASATGASQTRFASSPDVFSVSQSWGWKSSSLRTEEYIEVGEGTEASVGTRGREVSLRACIVLGLV